jgi:TAT (twin-arginine translocation) pathway signal sequence
MTLDISRREFLTAVAGAGAALAIQTSGFAIDST